VSSDGDLRLTGNSTGFTGTVAIDGVTTGTAQLILDSGGNLSAITSATIGAVGRLITTSSNQINDSAALVVNGNFILGGNEQVGTLSGTNAGAVTNLGVNTLTTSTNSDSSYAGSLVGTGGSLVKAGTGTLTLGGTNTYTGATALNAGAITLLGTLSSDVTIGSSGTLFVEIASLASFDKVLITGTANVSVAGGFLAAGAGDQFTIIDAAGGVTGTFTTATLPAAYNASISYTATTVVITLADITYASSGNTSNQKAVAAALDNVRRNSPTGDASTVITTLNGFSAATLRGALDQIASAPIEYDASMHSSIQGVSGITRTNLGERYSCLRTQQTGNNLSLTNLLNNRVTFSNQNLLASMENRVLPQPTSTAQSPWGVFASGSAQRSDMETINQQAGYEFTSYGITTGVDYAFGPNFSVGGYLSYADSRNDVAQGLGTIDSTSFQTGLYAQWHDQQGLYFNASLGRVWLRFKPDEDAGEGEHGGEGNV
jgi:autotransporter-associated beta strand protein